MGEGIKAGFEQVKADRCVGRVIPQIVEFIGIVFQVKEFPVGMTVVDTELMAARAVHGAKVNVKVTLIAAWPIRVERAVIFTAHSLAMVMRVGLPREDGQQ